MPCHNFTFFIPLLFAITYYNPAVSQQKTTLNITIENIQTHEGSIYLAVYDNKEAFMKNHIAESIKKVGPQSDLSITIALCPGTYAISIFHDENNNGKLDKNFIGIPREPYGFSNNPRIRFGPPGFNDCAFEFSPTKTSIRITLK